MEGMRVDRGKEDLWGRQQRSVGRTAGKEVLMIDSIILSHTTSTAAANQQSKVTHFSIILFGLLEKARLRRPFITSTCTLPVIIMAPPLFPHCVKPSL